MKHNSTSELEKYYEDNILIEHNLDADVELNWGKHVKLSDGVFAHYFVKTDVNYILVFKKDLSLLSPITDIRDAFKPRGSIVDNFMYIKPDVEVGYIENITGYFLLYYEY